MAAPAAPALRRPRLVATAEPEATAATPGRLGQMRYLSQKTQVSAVYWLTPSVGLQVGGLFALRGVNSDAERGVFSALWVKF